MIIAIAGVPGSGKTSVSRILSDHFHFPRYSMGGLRSKMAIERGMTISQLNALGEQEAFTDKDVDDYQKHLGETEDDFVIEGRLSWHFIPHAFKVFLACDPHEAAKRIFAARQDQSENRDDEPLYTSVDEAEQVTAERMASDDRRYQKYYGIDYKDPSHYDLVIDTTHFSGPDVTAEAILKGLPR
ncbi:MAG: AAA family ATPase [Candidatus Uhrbacteria bacterium]|nr:AAA family ATPase [Candidatus Uhrbacteria bacterium]